MNLLQSNSAPFLLALIVSALGWYVGQINTDIRTTRVATYRLERDDEGPRASVIIENVSRTESLENITFALRCRGEIDQRLTDRNRGGVSVRPPIAPIGEVPVVRRREAGEVSVAGASLAPGGAIGLQANLADCRSPLDFYYRPEGTDRFLLLNAKSLEGWMAANYITTLPVLFLLFLAIFVAWLVMMLTIWWRGRHEVAVAGNVYHVRLHLDDSVGRWPGAAGQDQGDGARGEFTDKGPEQHSMRPVHAGSVPDE